MGRTVPSASFRVDSRVEKWKKLYDALDVKEKASFDELLGFAKRVRNTIMEMDEDSSVLMLLAMLVMVKKEINELKVMGIQRKGGIVGQPAG